jgi:hypothetical protein
MKKYNNEKAIISLTSWKKRIDTVAVTIQSILERCPGYHVVLCLSSDEFPRKEAELPENLNSLINNNQIEILWVKKNYGPFKKVLFTAKKYPTAPIISADDGVIYIENFAENLYKVWIKNRRKLVSWTHYRPKGTPIDLGNGGRGILYPPGIFNRYIRYLEDDRIIKTFHDDMFIGFLAKKYRIGWKFLNPLGVRRPVFVNIPSSEKYGLCRNKCFNNVKAYKVFLNRIRF